jgi:AraC-like DNA-binding protein
VVFTGASQPVVENDEMSVVSIAEFDRAALSRELADSLVQLLECARRNLEADRESARASLARASCLLQIELERRAGGGAERAPRGALAGWQVQRVKAHIDAHLEETLHIRELAEVAQRSSGYFCRAFKRTVGRTPHAYILDRRLDRASELMLTSDVALSEIALTCGFSDQAHLCKAFRARYGQSPAAWRRERRDLSHLNETIHVGSDDVDDYRPLRRAGRAG